MWFLVLLRMIDMRSFVVEFVVLVILLNRIRADGSKILNHLFKGHSATDLLATVKCEYAGSLVRS